VWCGILGLLLTASAQLPEFTFDTLLIDPSGIDSWKSSRDLVAPNVIRAVDYFQQPLGTYYMYVGPHDHGDKNGIHLFYSDALRGPWTWHGQVVADIQAASTVFWDDERGRMLLISHGPNRHNHIYESEDGIAFSHIREMTDLERQPFGYGKVFEYRIPGRDNKYVLLINFRTNNDGYAGILVSNDGIYWETISEDAYKKMDEKHVTAHSPFLLEYGSKKYVIVVDFWNSAELWAMEVDDALMPTQYLGTYVSVAEGDPIFSTRISYPFIFRENDSLYLFAAIGEHQRQSIALLTAPDSPSTAVGARIFSVRRGQPMKPLRVFAPVNHRMPGNALTLNGRIAGGKRALMPLVRTNVIWGKSRHLVGERNVVP
jgi:hypothetical protein